ncbi:hypothetical protein [Embleya scabrispora]|uniref:hypothetical protein n=1 Tax=Embleya scabrispora TaxID=159449 RepID=UPI0003706882|nr:hypothetical protein [Embleya scabrispora]MYS80303.1 hypothetical protein [Streptomyces sp. SID5474]
MGSAESGGRGPNGEQPGPSPFGPLELPRDETEVLPRFEDYADQGPPQGYGAPQQYPGQQQPYGAPQPPYDPDTPYRPNPADPPGATRLGPPPVFAPPAGPGQVPPRPPHAPPGASAAAGVPMGAGAPPAGPDPFRPSPAPAAGPADATQAFPVSLFRDEAGGPPAGPGPMGAPGQPMPPAYSAQPAPPGHSTPPPAGYAAPQPYAPHYAPPTGPPHGPGPDDHAGSGPTGRSRTPLIAAGVGALVVVAAIGAFAGGAFGDDDKSDTAGKGAATTAPVKPDASGAATPGTTAPPAKADNGATAQASAVDRLLQDGAGSRQAVSRAVQQIQKCEDPAAGAQSLTEAARQRDQQIAGLAKLSTDKLGSGAELVAGLREAWAASAESDRELAAWGTEMAHGGCKDHRAEYTEHKRAADRAGGRATTAKNKVVGLWNPIASDNNLKKRSAGDF